MKNLSLLIFAIIVCVVVGSIIYFTFHQKSISQSTVNTLSASPVLTSIPNQDESPNTTNTFVSQEGDFQAVFPDSPKRNILQLPVKNFIVNAVQYVSNNPPKPGAMVEVFTFPAGYLHGQAIQESLDGVTRSSQLAIPDSTLVSIQFSSYQNYPAIDGLIQIGSRYLQEKNIVVGDKMYAVSTLSEDKSDATFSQFMNSFELVKK